MADGKPTSLDDRAITVSTESAQARRAGRSSRGNAEPTPPPPPLTTRDSLRYEIIGEYGRGGLGLVHRAYDRALGRDVAIKELLDRTSHVGEVRFLREAMITARLDHPGIVPIHEAGRWADGTPFYAMKLVAGRSLRDLIAERKTVDERIALLHHVIAVADAIAYAHGKDIIHRDLKPANVIVGDFGETIVIDWGLAKDLTLDEPDPQERPVKAELDPASLERSSQLTTVGTVIGTPAYMAPEQERGERVDRRADVFSIGAMLWELCALDHKPPSDPRQRERVLGRNGIDRDLIEIMQKALASDPAARYADAGALASDLKAFKSGAQITARRYSSPARFMRWVRRRRALAATAGVAIAVIAISSVMFVRGLAVERDRADAASSRATQTANDLTLEHAELLLQSDPTAAAAALTDYRGHDDLRRRRLLAEAEGLGTAVAITTPHNDTICLLAPTPDGGLITLSQDHSIRLTRNGATTTLSTDVSGTVRLAYSAARGLIAFATARPGVAVLDVATRRIVPLTQANYEAMAFSPDGDRLVAIDDHQGVHLWTTDDDPREVRAWPDAGARLAVMPSRDRVVIQRADGLSVLGEDQEPPLATAAVTAATTDASVDARDDVVALGTDDGELRVLSGALVERGRGSVCRDRVRLVQIIPHRELFVFTCQDRLAGIARFDAARRAVTTVETFATHGIAVAYPDPTGRFVEITDESHTAYLYDLDTHLLHRYDGSAGLPAYVLAPSAHLPFVVVGDVNGTVRMWPAPATAARSVLRADDAVFALAFAPDGKSLITGGKDHVIHVLDLAHGGDRVLAGHTGAVWRLRVGADNRTLVSVGYDYTVRVWRTDGGLVRTFADHSGEVTGGELLGGDRRVISAGADGRLLAWSIDGNDTTVLYRQPTALESLVVLGGRAVVHDADNRVLVVDTAHPGSAPRVIRGPGGDAIVTVRASPDARWLATGSETGEVIVYDTATWQVSQTEHAPGSIRQIVFDPRGRDLAIATDAGRALVGHVQFVPLIAANGRARAAWRDVPATVRDVAYTPDGETLAFITGDGGTWLYVIARDVWAYTRDHDADMLFLKFSPDGTLLATCDRRGGVVVRDIATTLSAARDRRAAR